MANDANPNEVFTITIWRGLTSLQWIGRITCLMIFALIHWAIFKAPDWWIMSWQPFAVMIAFGLVGSLTEGSIDADHRPGGRCNHQ